MTVSTRSTQPCLSYILIQFAFIACFTRAPGQRRFQSFRISPANLPWSLRPKKVRTSSARRQSVAWRERRGVGNQDVGGVAGLVGGPVVAIARKQIARERIHPAGEPLEDHRPGQARKPIGEPLGAARVFEPEEGIVEAPVTEAALIELVGEPVVAVRVDLDRERGPGLQADVEQAGGAAQRGGG